MTPAIRTRRFIRAMHLLGLLRSGKLPAAHDGNRVKLLRNGPDFFRSLFTSIRSAERFILAEYYIIRDDETGRAFADELIRAARRSVRVWLIYDYIGSVETPSSFFEKMAEEGVELLPFNVPSFKRGLSWFDRRDHRKMTLIDGALAFLGSFNVGDEYAGRVEEAARFHDIGFTLAGSAVSELSRVFIATWQAEGGAPFSLSAPGTDGGEKLENQGQANVTIVNSGFYRNRSHIHNAFLMSIVTASEEILIATPYFVPGPRILRDLMRAARRGVSVRILLPARSDLPVVQLLGRSYYGALLREGIEIRELGREILHAKVVLTDGDRAVIGSANLDQRSFHRNFEINLVIRDPTFGGAIREKFLEDLADSRPVTLEDHEHRGIITRILERIVNLFGWFL